MKTTTKVKSETVKHYESEGYKNRSLSQNEIKRMLHNHKVNWSFHHGILLTEDENGGLTVAISNWTLFDLMNFLDY